MTADAKQIMKQTGETLSQRQQFNDIREGNNNIKFHTTDSGNIQATWVMLI